MNSKHQRFLDYVGFTAEDGEALRFFHPRLHRVRQDIVDAFYRHVLADENTRAVLKSPAQVPSLRETLLEWLDRLLRGPWDEGYFRARSAIGRRHVDVELPQSYLPLAMFHIRHGLNRLLSPSQPSELAISETARAALDKLTQVELAVMIESHADHHDEQLRRSERLATLGQLAASVSHELRNPLGVINTSVLLLRQELGRKDSPDLDTLTRHLDRVERASRQAGRMSDQLLDFARHRTPKPRRVAVQGLIEDALFMIDDRLGSELCGVTEPADATAILDPDLIAQAIADLVRNSVQAMSEAGQPGKVQITATRRPRSLDIEVKDEGPGFPPELAQRILEPLFSTRAFGSGLGLPIVRGIVAQHQGSLAVDNAEPRGVRALITIPQNDARQASDSAASES